MDPAGPVGQLDALTTTLTDIAEALVAGHGDQLLATEAVLASTVALLDHTVAEWRRLDPHDRAALAPAVAAAQGALARCRRHGAVLEDIAGLVLAATGQTTTYSRQGASRGVDTRAHFVTRG